jgi:hypothetical protein
MSNAVLLSIVMAIMLGALIGVPMMCADHRVAMYCSKVENGQPVALAYSHATEEKMHVWFMDEQGTGGLIRDEHGLLHRASIIGEIVEGGEMIVTDRSGGPEPSLCHVYFQNNKVISHRAR